MNDKIIRKNVYADLDENIPGFSDIMDKLERKDIRYYIRKKSTGFAVGEIYKAELIYRAEFRLKEDAIIFATSLYCAERYREMKAIENELNELCVFEEWAMGDNL